MGASHVRSDVTAVLSEGSRCELPSKKVTLSPFWTDRTHQCIGGRPCLNCTKTNRACETTTLRKNTAPIFVHATQTSFSKKGRSHVGEIAARVPARAPSIRDESYVTYFFTSFLYQNVFTSEFATALSPLLHYSPELRDAVSAIAALHMTQHGQSTSDHDDKLAALQAYSQSVRRIQERIASQSFIRDPSSLWTTLLLGVFEVSRFRRSRCLKSMSSC